MPEIESQNPEREKIEVIMRHIREFAVEMESDEGVKNGMKLIYDSNKDFAIDIVWFSVMSESNKLVKPLRFVVMKEDLSDGIKKQIIDMFETVFATK